MLECKFSESGIGGDREAKSIRGLGGTLYCPAVVKVGWMARWLGYASAASSVPQDGHSRLGNAGNTFPGPLLMIFYRLKTSVLRNSQPLSKNPPTCRHVTGVLLILLRIPVIVIVIVLVIVYRCRYRLSLSLSLSFIVVAIVIVIIS